MKRFLSITIAIVMVFSFSMVGFAYTHPDYNLTSYIKINRRNGSPALKAFFVDFFNAPKDRRFIAGTVNGAGYLTYSFFLFDDPVPIIHFFRDSNSANWDLGYFSNAFIGDVTVVNTTDTQSLVRFPNADVFVTPRSQYPYLFAASQNTSLTFSFIVMDSTTIKFDASAATNMTWNWKKTTPFEVIFDDDLPPKPPDPPPSFPEFPPIVIPPMDPPDLVPPYDDKYIWYDPSVWEDFFKHISKDIGSAVNIGIILIGLLFGIYLIIRVIRHYVRGDDLFKG